MKYLDLIMEYAMEFLPSLILAVVGAVVVYFVKKLVGKKLESIDVEKISQQTIDKTMDKIKGVAFTHSIEPIVKNEMAYIKKYAEDLSKSEVQELHNKYLQLIDILQAMKNYFDDSAFISHEKKEIVQGKIDEAKVVKEDTEKIETTMVVEEIKQEKKIKNNIQR